MKLIKDNPKTKIKEDEYLEGIVVSILLATGVPSLIGIILFGFGVVDSFIRYYVINFPLFLMTEYNVYFISLYYLMPAFLCIIYGFKKDKGIDYYLGFSTWIVAWSLLSGVCVITQYII